MTVQMVTVTWDETDIGGAGLTGTIRFLLSAALVNAATGQIYEPDSRSYAITSGTGQTVPIVPNDSADLTPSGTYYTVTIAIAGQAPRVLTKLVNSASGATQKLAALPDVVPQAAAPLALPLPLNSPPQAGQVPVAIGDGSDNTNWGSGGGGGGGFANPMTAVGDLIIGGTVGAATRLPGNTTTTRKFLRQTGTGSAATAEVWDTLLAADVPTLNQNTTGTAANVTGTVAIANGGTGQTSASAALSALGGLPKAGGTMTGALIPSVITLTDAATVAIDASQGNQFVLTATAGVGATRQLGTPSNPADGQQVLVDFIQDASGSRALTFSAAYDFGTTGAPTFSTGANKIDTIGFRYKAVISKWTYLGSGLGF